MNDQQREIAIRECSSLIEWLMAHEDRDGARKVAALRDQLIKERSRAQVERMEAAILGASS